VRPAQYRGRLSRIERTLHVTSDEKPLAQIFMSEMGFLAGAEDDLRKTGDRAAFNAHCRALIRELRRRHLAGIHPEWTILIELHDYLLRIEAEIEAEEAT
jgi:hypothetical protein